MTLHVQFWAIANDIFCRIIWREHVAKTGEWARITYRELRALGIKGEKRFEYMREWGGMFIAALGRKVFYQFGGTYVVAPSDYSA